MSEELKRKLQEYEVNPPERTWDKIAAALEGELYAEFPQKLYNAEINPPADSWNKITIALDNDMIEEYPAKLYALEVEPPAGAWQKISAALEEEKALPHIPARRKIVPFVRYAAAACLIGLIAFGSMKLLNKKTTGHSVAGKNSPASSTIPGTTVQPDKNNPGLSQTPEKSNNLPGEKTLLAKADISSKKRSGSQFSYMTQPINVSHDDAGAASESDFRNASLQGAIPGSSSVIAEAADRYLMFLNPDGYLIRMSKKLAEKLGCLYTNGNSEEYKQCQDQIKKWRDKLAQSPVSPSQDNFMDILNLIKTLQDNEL